MARKWLQSFRNEFLLFVALFGIGFVWRVYGLLDNHPFWVDEFSSAYQARLILQYGLKYLSNPSLNVEYNNILNHLLIALSFKFFGQYEWAARLPYVVIGSLIPVCVYILAKQFFNKSVALSAGLFTAFSYLQITWSRQARGYVLTQLWVILTLTLYIHILTTKRRNLLSYIAFFISVIVGLLTHFSFVVLLIAISVHSISLNLHLLKKIPRKPYFFAVIISTTLIGLKMILGERLNNVSLVNNVWYYHSFLWREHGLMTFLALLGLIGTFIKKARVVSIFALYISIHIGIFTFLFAPYSSRYLLPIFPLLFIFAALALEKFMNATITVNKFGFKQSKMAIIGTLLLTLFIISGGDKFVTRPRPFYSVNHDFREIALIDYNKVYGIIKEKGRLEEGHTAVIDTWHDRLYWYIGNDYYPSYLFRWADDPGTTNGLARQTTFLYNTQGEKIIPRHKSLGFVGDLSDLMKVKEKYPQGFIFIDDATLPADVLKYASENLNKELFLDHYPLDDNPYSIWPATLYSWGIQSKR